ncbi:hypothetical protein LINPERHAP1_LOCUS17682 [Linum perenne]
MSGREPLLQNVPMIFLFVSVLVFLVVHVSSMIEY